MAVMEHFDFAGRLELGSSAPNFGPAVAALTAATTSSAVHIHKELNSAISSVLRLLALLEKFETQGLTQRQCARIAVADLDLCSRIAPLLHATSSLRDLRARFIALQDLLVDGAEEALRREDHSGATRYPFQVSLGLIKADCEAVEIYAAVAQSARESVVVGDYVVGT